MIWPRVAPAARSRPSSRARSVTVIDRVLKIRNAPTNSAIAAMSAVVAWKSTVERRSDAASSAGDDRTYGSAGQRASSAAPPSRPGRRALAGDDVDPGDGRGRRPLRRRERQMTVRPPRPADGPSPARIPTIGTSPGRPARDVTVAADREAVGRGQRLGDERRRLVRRRSAPARLQDEVVDLRLRGRVDPEDGHRRPAARPTAPAAR